MGLFIAKTGELQLDRAIVTREVGFYALSIVLLYIALQDIEPVEDDDVEHIFISFPEACMIFSGYIAYVLVCANMKSIVAFFGGPPAESTSAAKGGEEDPLVPHKGSKYGAMHERTISQEIELPDDLPYVTEKKNLSSEPASNWAAVSLYLPNESLVVESTDGDGVDDMAKAASSGLGGTKPASMGYTRSSILKDFFQNTEAPSKTHDLYEVKHNEFTNNLECFLWQKSFFYTKAYFGNHAWHLRWFNFSADYISSVPDRQNSQEHKMVYCNFNKIIIDENRLIIELVNSNSDRRNCK